MTDYKLILGVITIVIGVLSYSFYLRDIFKNKIKPDPYSWLIWGVLAAIAFSAQLTSGADFGSWATALTSTACLFIAAVSFRRSRGRIKTIDEISLIGALLGVILWGYTKDPLFAVFCVVLVGAIGFAPMFYQAFYKPHEENTITFALNALKFVFSFFALNSANLVTGLYPIAMIVMNISLVAVLLWRR